jgi:hypothetical protein
MPKYFTATSGLLKKRIHRMDPNTTNERRVVGQKLRYTAASESAISSFQMVLSLIKRQQGHCREENHARIATYKKRRSLRIFSAHITTNAIEIVLSAPLGRRAIIRSREYFLFPDPKHPSTSFRLR